MLNTFCFSGVIRSMRAKKKKISYQGNRTTDSVYISQFEEICRFVFSTFGISIDYIKRNEVVRPALDLYARVLRSQHEFAKMSEVICACGSFSATAWRRKLKKGERSVFNRSCTALLCLAADYRR